MKDDSFLLKMEGQAEEEIRGRAKYDPIIYRYLKLHIAGVLTYEQALQGMVIHLSNEKARLQNELIREKQNKVCRPLKDLKREAGVYE